jgi:hypothetical protein
MKSTITIQQTAREFVSYLVYIGAWNGNFCAVTFGRDTTGSRAIVLLVWNAEFRDLCNSRHSTLRGYPIRYEVADSTWPRNAECVESGLADNQRSFALMLPSYG